MKSIGIDIGTTTISIAVMDGADCTLVHKATLANDSSIPSGNPWERVQDPPRILSKAQAALEGILRNCPDVSSIGLTGQMHGIVYVNASGNAVSPLYTWQDKRGDLPCFQGGRSVCAILSEDYGIKASAGYGLATHLYHVLQGLVPRDAVSLCTVADYLGMRLTGRTAPLLHISQAAGLGLYDCGTHGFLRNAIAGIGGKPSILPEITAKPLPLGAFRGIPVSVSIGDNQASFLGSVRDGSHDLLVNIGTGSQISVLSSVYASGEGIEARPFTEDTCLLVGAALCGGSAFAMLERFFREYAVAAGGPDVPQYEIMKKLIEAQPCSGSWTVRTTFAGTRENPREAGSISDVRTDNFHPQALIRGVLEGMAEELHTMYRSMALRTGSPRTRLIASGNGVRRNPALLHILQNRFAMPLELVPWEEEAAFGAAVFSLAAIDRISIAQWMEKGWPAC